MKILIFLFFQILFEYVKNQEARVARTPINSFDDILYDAMENNPKDKTKILPALPKIVTRSGYFCDFPFIYKNRKYYTECAFKEDNKSYCKINLRNHSGVNVDYFEKFNSIHSIDSIAVMQINNEYFSECLSVDETQQFMNQLVESDYDFKAKLLIDLYSDIKKEILHFNLYKLNLLFDLSESYCKSSNFNFDCLYENLVKPISKTQGLKELTGRIFVVLGSYKKKLTHFLEKRTQMRFKQMDFEFINQNNLQLNRDHGVTEVKRDGKFTNEEREIALLINKESKENNAIYTKINMSKFFEILTSIYEICTEECKAAVDYLFVENFGNKVDRVKLEVVLTLLEYPRVNETEFRKEIYTKLPNDTRTYIRYKNHPYVINPQLERFLNYKSWSIRYLITMIYRYILMEKLFYVEIIQGKLTEEEFNLLLFPKPTEKLDEQNKLKILRILPMLSPFVEFSKEMQKKIENVYLRSSNITEDIYKHIVQTNDTLGLMMDLTDTLTLELKTRNDFMQKNVNSTIAEIKDLQDKIKEKKQILSRTGEDDSLFTSIKLKSENKNINHILKNIYITNYLSQDCHRFLHYHTYYKDFSIGKPSIGYVSLSYDPFFFIDFDPEIKLFFIYGLLNMNTVDKKQYKIIIRTQAEIDLYINYQHIHLTEKNEVPEMERFKNMIQYTFIYQAPGFKNSFRELKVKGNFKPEENNKRFEFHIEPVLNFENKKTNKEAGNKCEEELNEVSLCFHQNLYKIGCDVGCKYLTKGYDKKLKNRFYIEKAHKTLYEKSKPSHENSEEMKDQIKKELVKFNELCENYCSAFMWTIPMYKCLMRNVQTHNFESVLIKCGALGNWRMAYRNTGIRGTADNLRSASHNNSPSKWFNFMNNYSFNDVLLGKKFYIDDSNTNVKPKYIRYMIPTIVNPLSQVSFIRQFNYESINEFMFASGDMNKFAVLDKFQPFIKGSPFNAFSSLNNKMMRNSNTTLNEFEISIFNFPYNTDYFDSNGIVIFESKHNTGNYSESSVLYSDNSAFNNNKKYYLKERDEIFEKIQGANIFIRKNEGLCLSKHFFTSNLLSKEYYIESVLLRKDLYAFVDSEFLIVKVPEDLEGKVLLLKANSYQSQYSLNVNTRSRLYMAVEVTQHFEKIYVKLISDGWKFLNGTKNMIEIVTSDVGDDMMQKDLLSFYECTFENNENPVCKDNIYDNLQRIEMSIFVKDVEIGNHPLNYSFFHFDDLYSSVHLLMIQSKECDLDDNILFAHQDKINNFMKVVNDYLPSYDEEIDNFVNDVVRSEISKIKNYLNVSVNESSLPDDNKQKTSYEQSMYNATRCNREKAKKFSDFLNFLQKENKISRVKSSQENLVAEYYEDNLKDVNKFLKNLQAHGYNTETYINKTDPDFDPSENLTLDKLQSQIQNQLKGKRNYARPSVKFNQNGCVLSLDRFGNLYFKHMSDIIHLSNNTQWALIKSGVSKFEMSENIVIIMDFSGNIFYMKGIVQDNKCMLKEHVFNKINFTVEFTDSEAALEENLRENTTDTLSLGKEIEKLSLSMFNCLWVLDREGNLYFSSESPSLITDTKWYLKLKKLNSLQMYIKESTTIPKIKSIYQYAENLYLISTDNKIYVKGKVFDFFKGQCVMGDALQEINEYNNDYFIKDNLMPPSESLDDEITNSKIQFEALRENINSAVIVLDRKGKLYYRKFANEMFPRGKNWQPIQFEDKENKEDLDKLIDFDLGPKDIIMLNANGKITVLYDINRPRLYDI